MTKKRFLIWSNLASSLLVGVGMMYGLSHPFGSVPSMVNAMNPQNGVWATAAQDQVELKTQMIQIPRLQQQVNVMFESDGTPHIQAKKNSDLWQAIGYLHAKNRLFQMDLMRRQGAGFLSEVLGKRALEADKFQNQLGLARAADEEWKLVQSNPETREVLESYALGVNAVIDEQKHDGTLPLMFKMLSYEPEPWKPQDSLVIKGVLAQMMSLDNVPMFYSAMEKSLGYERTMELFPVMPNEEYHPYDHTPPAARYGAAMPISAEKYFQKAGKREQQAATAPKTKNSLMESGGAVGLASVLDILKRFENLPDSAVHRNPNSNAWVIDGSKTESGKPLLASDPHLDHTLPAVWYQLQVEAPDYRFSGVSVPGIPLVLIGSNDNISWGLTNGQTQQTFFYQEVMDSAHPDQYYWQGEWHTFVKRNVDIPLKGGGSVPFVIKTSVHGPVIEERGVDATYTLDWLGAIPSHSFEALLGMVKAKDYGEFKVALQNWTAPTMNFAYADRQGEIAMITAGYFPVFALEAKPWLPLKGSGEFDFRGTIPFADVPQEHNPSGHILGSANQRPVSAEFPYYVGTTMHFATPYRAERIYDALTEKEQFSQKDFQQLQLDVKDSLAEKIVPALLTSLAKADLSPQEREAATFLQSWDYRMTEDSKAATVWNQFWGCYIKVTFEPWWQKYKVPVETYDFLAPSVKLFSLNEDLAYWTLHEPQNQYFSNPVTQEQRNAADVMQQAFRESVQELKELASIDTSKWGWGSIHSRSLPSLVRISALGYAPRSAGGGSFTLNYASGLNSVHGPSWRMITDLGTGRSVGIYLGGQSENPVSPLYGDRIEDWWQGQYRSLLSYEEAAANPERKGWTLIPDTK